MPSNPPVVSVLTTAWNAMPWLEEAVNSILEQDFWNFEFVIVNDGSTDDSRRYLDSIEDSRVRLFHCENRGTAAASNFGLQQCRGKYIARMDADDISLPGRLSTQVKYLDAHPEIGLVGANVQIFGSARSGLTVRLPSDHEEIYAALLRIDNGITHGVCMYRRSLIEAIGGYWDLRSYDDWDMFIRMGEISRLANIDEVLYMYRYLPNSLVHSGLRNGRRHYAYSAELARRRAAAEEPISFEQFCEELDSQPVVQRAAESIGNFALNQYRIANIEMCNGKMLQGRCRLLLAAASSPRRTVQRLRRMISA